MNSERSISNMRHIVEALPDADRLHLRSMFDVKDESTWRKCVDWLEARLGRSLEKEVLG